MSELLSNAIKFNVEGIVEFGVSKDGDYVNFYVKDSGIGIEESKYQVIFVRFTHVDETISENYGGTGLGLSISKEFVEVMGEKFLWKAQLEKELISLCHCLI